MFFDRWVDKEGVAQIYNEILLSHKKEWIWVEYTGFHCTIFPTFLKIQELFPSKKLKQQRRLHGHTVFSQHMNQHIGKKKQQHSYFFTAAAKSLQSYPTLCDPIDSSLPGSSFPGTLQARTLEWVAISFSNAWKWKVRSCSTLSNPMDCSLPGSSVHGIFQQEYWSGLPLPSPIV